MCDVPETAVALHLRERLKVPISLSRDMQTCSSHANHDVCLVDLGASSRRSTAQLLPAWRLKASRSRAPSQMARDEQPGSCTSAHSLWPCYGAGGGGGAAAAEAGAGRGTPLHRHQGGHLRRHAGADRARHLLRPGRLLQGVPIFVTALPHISKPCCMM